MASGEAATLKVYSPARMRVGDISQARFTIDAHRELRRAGLRLDPGWFEGMSINSIEPQPRKESSDSEGRPVLTLGRIAVGARFRLFIYFQANPTNPGRRSQDVELLDGDEVVARLDRTVTIFP